MGIVRYLSFAFFISIGVSIFVAFAGLAGTSSVQLFGLGVMLAPSLIVFGMWFVRGNAWPRMGFGSFDWRVTLGGILLIVAVSHIAMFLGTLVVYGKIPTADWVTNASSVWSPPPEMKIGENLTIVLLAWGVAQKLIVGLVIVSFFALAEEVGWRGFLESQMVISHGVFKGLILTALSWAAWHVPFALSGLHDIQGVGSLELAFVMFLGLFGAGLFLGVAFNYSKSIWAVALVHGALNNWAQFFFRWFSIEEVGLNRVLIWSQNLGLLMLGVVTFLFYRKYAWSKLN